jgi:hypothetical protein
MEYRRVLATVDSNAVNYWQNLQSFTDVMQDVQGGKTVAFGKGWKIEGAIDEVAYRPLTAHRHKA